MSVSQKSKSLRLRKLLNSNDLEFAMECHSGISAVIAEEAGFKCLWASGLSVSAMTGCRDRNELDISEVSKVVEWMADHTSVPILVDGDTGGVDYNSARIMVNKLTKAGAAGVCIEDKLYPKHNSFLSNSDKDLAEPEQHAGKIKSMKDENPDFVVVARLEGFIAKSKFTDIISRAKMYADAGADAILVHSKIKNSSEIDRFMEYWNNDDNYSKVPVVIVPTKYYNTPTDHFREIGVSTVIWANHQMRASIRSMQDVCKSIYNNQSLVQVESEIATVNEIFRLQRDDYLQELEKKYLPSYKGYAVILSAVKSKVSDLPKALDTVGNSTVLDKQIKTFSKDGISNFIVVSGYESNKFDLYNVTNVLNNKWSSSTEVYSSLLGVSSAGIPLYISYGDIVFKDSVLTKMSSCNSDIVIGVADKYKTLGQS